MQIEQLIKSTKGKIFSVDFVKSDGTSRHMVARLGVSKGVNGRGLAFEPKSHDLIVAWDTVKRSHRMIPINRILSFKCGDKSWRKQ